MDPRAALLLAPLALAALAAACAPGRFARPAAVVAAVGALGVALAGPSGGPHAAPWLLLGALAGLDLQGRLALFVVAAVLLPAGPLGGAPGVGGGAPAAWRALLAGGLAATAVAWDAATLALGYTALLLGAYGLAAEGRPGPAGARAYLGLAVLGEVLLVDGLLELGHAAAAPALDRMREAAGAELGGGAMLLLAAAYGLPLGLVGVGGPARAVAALAVASLVGVLRVLPGPGVPVRDQALALGLVLAVGTAAAVAARLVAGRLGRRPASASGGGGHHHEETAPTPDQHPPLPWMGALEDRMRLLTASGAALVGVLVLLYVLLRTP